MIRVQIPYRYRISRCRCGCGWWQVSRAGFPVGMAERHAEALNIVARIEASR